MIKRIFAVLLAIGLMTAYVTALAEYGTYSYDGAVWNGTLQEGVPNGFGILTYDDGTVRVGLMENGYSNGIYVEMPYAINHLEDIREDFYLTVGQDTDGVWDGTFYRYTPSGEWRQTIYIKGVPISRIQVNQDGSVTEYAFENDAWISSRDWTPDEIQGTVFAAGPMFMYVPQAGEALDIHFYNVDTQKSGAGIYFGPGLYGMPDTVYSYRYGYSDLAVSGSLPNGIYVEGRLWAGQYHGLVKVTQPDGSSSTEARTNAGFTNAMLHTSMAEQIPFGF